MKILITGMHGFIGSNLVKELSSHHEVYGLDIISPKKEGVLHTYNWENIESLKLPHFDIIIHLAGKAHDTKNNTAAATYFDINTGLTKKIFDYFLASNAQKFIFFSSVKAVADIVNGDLLTEEATPSPIGPYGESKLAAEQYILSRFPELGTVPEPSRGAAPEPSRGAVPEPSRGVSYQPSAISFEATQEQDATQNPELIIVYPKLSTHNSPVTTKKVYILRPCMIHGPGNKGNLNLLFNLVSKGIPWPLGSFDNRRSFTSIDNLKFVISSLMEKDISSGIYNMADDEPLSTNQLITIMSHTMNRKPRIWHFPKGWMTTFASLGTSLHLPLNKDRLQKLTENYVVSNEKIKKALGIKEMPISATEGLTRTIQSFNQ